MIVVVPDTRPLTIPVVRLTVAVAVVLLLQVPPVVISLNVIIVPAHRLELPVIAAGDGVTVIGLVTVQPVPNE